MEDGETRTSPDADEADRHSSLWRWLAERVDFARERPRGRDDLELTRLRSHKLGTYYILKNPRWGRYLKLTAEDQFLFSLMDGEHTVRDILLAYYRQFGCLAFSRVLGLTQELKEGGFLAQDQPRLLTFLRRRCARRDWLGQLAGLGQALLHRELAFPSIDRWVTALYRGGGWLLFGGWARVVYFALVSVGLALFGAALVGGAYSLVAVEGSYLLGGLVLGVLQLAVILVHEHAHALATKHFGREVTRGGFMLYLGLPAFFVDTSDIWMAPKRARLAVSWAGPYSEIILGGLTSISAWLLGPTVAGNVLFKFALLLYLGAFLNLNPLLELDGYYLLMDWLEVPMLRQRSFAFLRDRLLTKLRRREAFAPEERLFTWFGLFSLAYTVLALALALYFYYRYALGAAVLLWQTKSWLVRGLIVGTYAAVVLPLVYFVLLALLRGLRDGLRWVRGSAFFQDPYRLAALVVLGAVSLWYIPQKFFPAWDLALYGGLLGVGLVVVAGGALLLARWYDHPVPRVGAGLFALWAAGLLAAEVLLVAGWRGPARVDFAAAWGVFLASGVLAWRVTSAFRVRLRDLLLVAVVAGGSALVGEVLARPAGGGASSAWLLLAPACASLGLGWMTVAARAYRGTPLALGVGTAWCGLTLGVVATWLWAAGEGGLGGGSFALEPAVFGAALLVGGLAVVRLAYTGLGRARVEGSRALALSDAERLAEAFRVLVGSVLERFQALAGVWVLAALRERLAERGEFPREVGIDGVRVQVGVSPAEGILSLASRLRLALVLVFGEVRRYVRDTYLAHLVERVFGELSWDEREAVSEYLLRGEDWQRALVEAHQARRQGYASLLTQNPVFADLTAEEVPAVVGRLRPQRFRAGEVIVRQGDLGDSFYLIARGRVAVVLEGTAGPQEVAELVEGDYFGEIALLRETPRTATCLARTDVETLTLSREDFSGLLARHFAVAGKVEKVAALSAMLRRMPLFADFSPKQLQALLARLHSEVVGAGSVVIRQGEPGDRFYIVASGQVEVAVREEGALATQASAGSPSGTGERVVAHLGPGEYFGEIALLADVPRTATVRTVTECEFFQLSRQEFDELVRVQVLAGRHLEQVSSRRVLDTRRKLIGGTVAAGA
jgi:putative peptide zinc metalloprotease protein